MRRSPIYKNAVVSVGVGQWYPRGLDRLDESLNLHCFNGVRRLHRQWPGASHTENPYAFKIDAVRRAAEEGCECVLWLDASDWAAASLLPLFSHIDQHGFYMMRDGWTVAQWSTDQCLQHFGITRDAAEQIPLLWSNAFGVRMDDAGWEWLERMQTACDAGCFRGPWDNKDNAASSDVRCLGHRHDQTVASIVAWQMQLRLVDVGSAMVQTPHSGKPAVVLAQGM